LLSIVIQKSANNEIRLGLQSIRKLSRGQGDKTAEARVEAYGKAVQEVETIVETVRVGSRGELSRSGRWLDNDYGLQNATKELASPLDIINEFQRRSLSKREKGGWGFSPKPTTFSKYARHTLLEAGAICDRELGKNLVEITCTIPGSTREAFEAIANWSGWIMNRLCQLVRRNFPDAMWFYCWELQKRGALHLHFAIGHQSLAAAKSLAHQLEFQWWELLLELRDKAKVDVFDRGNGKSWRSQPQVWQSHVLPVYKSVAAYFSKYLGKGVGNRQRVTSRADFFCPARWWGCSSNLKQLIAESRAKWEIQVTSLQSDEIMYRLREFLSQSGVASQYNYEFDLGVSKKGYPIGGGWREIRYYIPDVFERMQTWLPSIIDDVCADMAVPESCIHRQPAVVCSEYDLVQQFKHSRDQAPPSPLNQPAQCQSDSLLSTGFSRKRTVDSKVIDIQSLREGRGGAAPTSAMSALPAVMSAQDSMQTSPCLQLSIPGLEVSSNKMYYG
jgi:hypothetical protein